MLYIICTLRGYGLNFILGQVDGQSYSVVIDAYLTDEEVGQIFGGN